MIVQQNILNITLGLFKMRLLFWIVLEKCFLSLEFLDVCFPLTPSLIINRSKHTLFSQCHESNRFLHSENITLSF